MARSLGAPPAAPSFYAFMLRARAHQRRRALYAMMFGFVDPDPRLGILISVKILIMAALGGGAGLLFGPLVRCGDPGAAGGESPTTFWAARVPASRFALWRHRLDIARFQPRRHLTLINRPMGQARNASEPTVAAGAAHAP